MAHRICALSRGPVRPRRRGNRVFTQIDNAGVYGVCALTLAGAIPFPPRNEGLDFMNQLDAKYRDELRRGPPSLYMNNEGRVVWVSNICAIASMAAVTARRRSGCSSRSSVRVFNPSAGESRRQPQNPFPAGWRRRSRHTSVLSLRR